MLVFFWEGSAGHGRGKLSCSDFCIHCNTACDCTSAAPAVLSLLPQLTMRFQPDFRNLSRRTGWDLLPCLAALARGLQELKVAFGAIHHGVLAAEH